MDFAKDFVDAIPVWVMLFNIVIFGLFLIVMRLISGQWLPMRFMFPVFVICMGILAAYLTYGNMAIAG